MLLGDLNPYEGKITKSEFNTVYVDQEYSLIDQEVNVYDFVQQFNDSSIPESEVKTLLARFSIWKRNLG
jgi:ATPase subunit of ABC transporter with duplicated ATPase domains